MGRADTTQIFKVPDFNTTPASGIATLQDTGYHVSDSNITHGSISATRKVYSDCLVTVTANAKDENFASVRASFSIPVMNIHPISQSQIFFQKLSRSNGVSSFVYALRLVAGLSGCFVGFRQVERKKRCTLGLGTELRLLGGQAEQNHAVCHGLPDLEGTGWLAINGNQGAALA